jgi:hypothetical protein
MAKQKLKVKFKGGKIEGNVIHARIPKSLVGSQINFPHRHMAIIDTGVEVTCPEGYKIGMGLVTNLSSRGMIAVNLAGGLKGGKVIVTLLNVGREIVELKDGDPLVQTWLEVDQKCEFETE